MKNLVNKGFKYFVAIMMVFSLMSMNAWANGPESSTSSETGSTTTENKGTTKDTGDSQGDTADQLISNEEKKTTTSKESDDKEGQTDQTTDKKTDYTYEDKKISVKAVLANASAISDQAELRVKEIPESTTEYKKYQEALNKKSNLYSNVLLYDISFMLNGKEVEPTDGNVKVSMSFKDQQLSDDLNVKDNNDLKVIHFKDNDVNKQETLKTTTSVKNETTSFETKSFSEFAFTSRDGNGLDGIDWSKDFVVLNNAVNGKFVYYFDNNKMTDSDYEKVSGKSNIALEYHYITDDSETFTGNPAATGYSANRVLGIPGNFHLVAFTKTTLSAHTNGNVMTKDLEANSNFGTSNYGIESSYVSGEYKPVNSNSGSNISHILAVSNSTKLGFADNGQSFTVKGTKLDKPRVIYRDSNSKKFIDMSAAKTNISNLSSDLAKMYVGTQLTGVSCKDSTYTLENPDGVGVMNMTADQVSKMGTDVWFTGFRSKHNGSIIINVDMKDVDSVTLPERAKMKIDGNEISTNETVDFSAGKIIWNFVNANEKTIIAKNMSGTIIAPESHVELTQNINGTIIADTVKNTAETHRSDFTGIIKNDETAFSVTKSFTNADWVGDTSYKFKFVSLINGQPLPENSEITLDKANRTKGFGNITYNYDDNKSGKTVSYYYKIYEDSSSNNYQNVVYDNNIYYVKVDVNYTNSNGVKAATITKTSKISTKDHPEVNGQNVTDSKKWEEFNRDTFKFEFNNTEKKLKAIFNKVSEVGTSLSRAEFTFAKLKNDYSLDGDAHKLKEDSGKYTADNLEDNTKYLLTETKAPNGYFTDGPWVLVIKDGSMKLYKASINEKGELTGISTEITKKSSSGFVFEYNIKDKNNLKLELIKEDETTHEKLKDAHFSLKEVTINENSIISQTSNGYSKDNITDVSGKTSFDNLNVCKKYLLKETKAPDGYNKNGPWIITVNDQEVTIQKISVDKDNKVTNIGDPETKPIDKTKTQLFVSETISDSKGATLPSTGGIGTKKYYLLGTLLSMLGVIYIVMKLGKGGLFGKEDHS